MDREAFIAMLKSIIEDGTLSFTVSAEYEDTHSRILSIMTTNARQRLAEDHNTSPDLLASLSQDDNFMVRLLVASNPNTSASTLTSMRQQNTHWGIHWRIAEHPSTPIEVVVSLAQALPVVQWGVVKNPNTPYGIWTTTWGRVLP